MEPNVKKNTQFKENIMLNFKGLICDKGTDEISIARIAFWITFGIICFKWFVPVQIVGNQLLTPAVPESLIQICYALLTYLCFHKATDHLNYKAQISEQGK
jgi:hypothetical protein